MGAGCGSQLFELQSQHEISAVATAAEIPEVPAPGCLQCKSGREPSENAGLCLLHLKMSAYFDWKTMCFTPSLSQKAG